MDVTTTLLISLVMYIIGIFMSTQYDLKVLFIGSGFLWFVPIFLIENTFILLFSVIMIIMHIIIAFYNDKESEY